MIGWKLDSGVYLVSNGNGLFKLSINGKESGWKSLAELATGALAKTLAKVVVGKPVSGSLSFAA